VKDRDHIAEKPIEVMRWVMQVVPEGSVVLDPFMGSGTTLLAARDLGRKAVGVELSERYCEIAATRLSQTSLDFGGAA